MPQPDRQHLVLHGGVSSNNSTIYTSSLIKAGDVIRIGGSTSNDGIYTVKEVVTTLNTGDGAGSSFTDNVRSSDITSGTTIILDGAEASDGRLVAGLSVSGTNIPAGAYIASVTQTSDPATFELSQSISGTVSGGATLTFADQDVYYMLSGQSISDDTSGGDPEISVIRPTGDKLLALGDVDNQGGVDIWSNNAVSNYTTKDSGWSPAEITPTTKGDNAKYIYHFVDGALRVCDINDENTSSVKWYGYIQRQQFNHASGLKFAEWQEHPNTLAPPVLATSKYTYAYGITDGGGSGSIVLDHDRVANYFLTPTGDSQTVTGGSFGTDPTITHSSATIEIGRYVDSGGFTGTADIVGANNFAVVKSVTDSTHFELGNYGSMTAGGAFADLDAMSSGTATSQTLTLVSKKYRGVAAHKQAKSGAGYPSDLKLGNDPSGTDTGLVFKRKDDGRTRTGQAKAGEVISIRNYAHLDDKGILGDDPSEFLFCKQGFNLVSGVATYSRNYGGEQLDGFGGSNYSQDDQAIIERGLGWNVGICKGTNPSGGADAPGFWPAGTWEFYETFIYDGNQESLPVQIGDGAYSTDAFEFTTIDNSRICVSIFADLAYSARISGGRIYIRRAGSDDELILLADIDIVKGVRTTLAADHKKWNHYDGHGFYYLSNQWGNSGQPNFETYGLLNGFDPGVKWMGIGGEGKGYKASTVANNRTVLANVKVSDDNSDAVKKHSDRIMYSEYGKYDTFLPNNVLDLPAGDFGEFVALETYSDKLIAFKHNVIYIINCSSSDPRGNPRWYIEETIRDAGVSFKFNVAKTRHGVVWINEAGCFLFNGRNVINLIEKRVGVTESSNVSASDWNTITKGLSNVKDAMVGYDAMTNSLIILKSPADSSSDSNKGFMYDFDTDAWVFHTEIFADSGHYTNFITDWNNNLVVGKYDGSSDVNFFKFLPQSLACSNQVLITPDIDFGSPGIIKKVYSVSFTYKAGTSSQANPLEYAINGTGVGNASGFSDITTGDGTITTGAGDSDTLPITGNSGADWDIAVFKPASPIECQSIQLRFNPPSSGVIEINDITFEYREIPNKRVS
tara:strand:- start:866 stop:4090 length:3225 start_codon:yes stop_codon:yes gene_type:complete